MKCFFLMSVATALVLTCGQAALAEEYLLSDQDRILLRAGKWNTADQVFEPWDGISGEYTVSPSGKLAISLIGQVNAAGRSTEDIADEIALAFQKQIGLPDRPSVSIEIVAYKPIYLAGSVNSPGSYGYQFGMTVEQAVAMAGGPPRLTGETWSNVTTALRLQGDIQRFSQRLEELGAQQERIDAELAAYSDPGQVDTTRPVVPGQGAAAELEADILDVNLQSVTTQKVSNKELQEVLTKKIKSLDDEIVLRHKQITEASAELDDVTSLKEKGLAVNARVTSLLTQLNDLEAKRIQLEIAKLTAEQQLNLARREEFTLVDDAKLRLLAEKKATQTEINELRILLDTTAVQYREFTAWSAAQGENSGLPKPRYMVTRFAEQNAVVLELQPTDRLVPGDTLTVVIDSVTPVPQN
jgi:protein involved in polysaccharide export with SLBB domain